MPTVTAFEEILRAAQTMACPTDDSTRKVTWLDDLHVLGLSRQRSGAFELFISGQRLYAASSAVKRHLEHDRWERLDGFAFEANRLVLPAGEHYIAIAAFIAEELARRDVAHSPVQAFAQTEPIIEVTIQRLTLTEEQILGLLGELRFLEALLSVSETAEDRGTAIAAWKGHERVTRDFSFGACSVEVKSTQSLTSSHHVSNVRQVDPERSSFNVPVEELLLLSLGFAAAGDGVGAASISLSNQVDAILRRLPEQIDTDLRSVFLDKVSQYGEALRGYHHGEMKTWRAYQCAWEHRFVRIYDMNDDAVLVLRRKSIESYVHVVGESVSFDVLLPHQVRGEANPHHDIYALARKCLGKSV